MPRTIQDLKAILPNMSATLHLQGLDDTVEILRDSYGIPHIRAQTVHDAFFGQGFATAQDRLFHMDRDRLVAYGRWAEYAGRAALEEDLLRRRFQILASVRRDYDAFNAETRAMVDAYAAGVNGFIETTESLPIEYGLLETEPEPWQPWDCVAVFKGRHMFMGVFEAKLWRARLVNALGAERVARILPGYQRGHLLIVPPGAESEGRDLDALAALSKGADAVGWLRDADSGSNNWAVAGSRTASGKPLLAGDPHRFLDTPNVYYQNHIACPEFDAIGLSFPGCPGFPHFGHNAHVAWCVTHAAADYQDLYIERFKQGAPDLYEYKGEWLDADLRREVVEVRGGESVELDVTVTQHGPIIAGDSACGRAVALKYTGIAGPNATFECLLQMLRAASADELETAMTDWVDPCNNFVFADVHGNIGYLMRGRLPVRSAANAWLPVPGWSGEHEWRGYVPFDELPRSRNPATGHIVTANNRIVGDDYPHYIALDFAPEHRARRVTDRLQALSGAGVEDMAEMHGDTISIPAQTYARLLQGIQPLGSTAARARDIVVSWDGSMERDAVAPTIYSAFRHHLDTAILSHLLGPLVDDALAATGRGAPVQVRQLKARFATMARDNDTSLLPPGASWSSLLAQALEDAVEFLKDRLGEDVDSWTWGRLHSTRPQHPLSESFAEQARLLDPPPMPVSGDGDTPQAASYPLTDSFEVTGTSVARYVFDTADWDGSRWIVPLGASGHPGSPHYADQTPIWSDVQLIPMLFSWERVAASAESRQQLKRGLGTRG